MSEELRELSRLLVGCKGWRWRDGMLTACGVRLIEGDSDYIIGHRSGPTDRGGGWIDTVNVRGFLPDLTDPATLGCLLQLVRDAWGNPRLVAIYCEPAHPGQSEGWAVQTADNRLSVAGENYENEAAALVAALEAAP